MPRRRLGNRQSVRFPVDLLGDMDKLIESINKNLWHNPGNRGAVIRHCVDRYLAARDGTPENRNDYWYGYSITTKPVSFALTMDASKAVRDMAKAATRSEWDRCTVAQVILRAIKLHMMDEDLPAAIRRD